MSFDLQPYLENDLLALRPLKEEDFENLFKVASDPLIWEQHPAKDRYQRQVFEEFFKDAICSKSALAIIDKKSGDIIGSTRFYPIKETDNAIEIGWTFLGRKYLGGHVNKSLKNLMMDYEFNFVENIVFYISENNIRSQIAVEKLGGQRITHLNNQLLILRPNLSFIYKIIKH